MRPMLVREEIARAKVNLTLEVQGKRRDGYHDLVSLVSFARIGDSVQLKERVPSGSYEKKPLSGFHSAQADGFFLSVSGPFSSKLEGENLLIKTISVLSAHFDDIPPCHLHLEKVLPVAAGLGGGSSDAAALIRLVRSISAQASEASDEGIYDLARQLGADVPVCLHQKTVLMSGTGEKLAPLSGFPELPCVLVNPGVPVSTAEVFRRLNARALSEDDTNYNHIPDLGKGAGLTLETWDDVLHYMEKHPNDLQGPALQIAPEIHTVLRALEQQTDCAIARMSGSGATCFGIFKTYEQARTAASRLQASYPDWWSAATVLAEE